MSVNRNYLYMIELRAYISEEYRLSIAGWGDFKEECKVKNVYLFGCNDVSKDVIKDFGSEWELKGILDNDKDKQGTEFEGLPVFLPEKKVSELSEDSDVVLIVMRKSADLVAKQLHSIGFDNCYSFGHCLRDIYPYSNIIERVEKVRNEPLEDIIMFESTNDVDGNSGALYYYLKQQKSKHKFVWVLKKESNKKFFEKSGDVGLCTSESIDDYIDYIYYINSAKWQIWDNLSIPKKRNDQINVFLQHAGLGYKLIDKFFKTPDYVDYWLCVNEFVKSMIQPSFRFPEETKTIYGTYPRNDVLLQGEWSELEKLTHEKYDKVIIWAPTLRQSMYFNRNDSDLEYPYGIPIIYHREDMDRLNQYLKNNSILMIIKPHPAQRMNYMTKDYSNVIVLDSDKVKKVHAYKLLTQTDAMISDYSSIVFDYMLLDRPIAWAIEDINHFKLDFLMENPEEYMPGEKIYDMDDLFTFLSHVKSGEDVYRNERTIISKRVNADMDCLGCENVVMRLGL